MKSAECQTTCEICGKPAEYADSIPDASVTGYTPSEAGYRLKALCWLHAAERKDVHTSRVHPILICGNVGRLDFDRAGGDCVCPECGRTYYRHPKCPEYDFLNLLCDGRLVKL